MEHKIWEFEVEGQSHVVQLDWTYWSGHRHVSVDGVPRHESVIPMRWRSTQAFDNNGNKCVVTTEPAGFLRTQFRIELRVDGKLIESQTPRTYWEVKDEARAPTAN